MERKKKRRERRKSKRRKGRKREKKEEKVRREREKEDDVLKGSIEKIFNEIVEFREDNYLSKVDKLPDIKQYLSEAISLKIRLLNTDTDIKRFLTVSMKRHIVTSTRKKSGS